MELRGFEPLALRAKIGPDLRQLFDGVVTRRLCVLGICVGVLRDVTVLAPVEPWSLGYELASPGVLESRVFQTYSSRAISRPICTTAYHAIPSVAPRFVHKSVHMLRISRPSPAALRLATSLCCSRAVSYRMVVATDASRKILGASGESSTQPLWLAL